MNNYFADEEIFRLARKPIDVIGLEMETINFC